MGGGKEVAAKISRYIRGLPGPEEPRRPGGNSPGAAAEDVFLAQL
jgi:hypothetical protein